MTAPVFLLGCVLMGSVALAEEPPQEQADVYSPGGIVLTEGTSTGAAAKAAIMPKWDGEAEAGIVMTGGNTQTESINTKFRIENERKRWRHRLNAEYFKASDKNLTTAERTSAAIKSDYKLGERHYLFAVVRYDSDTFSGYHTQISEVAGYGRRVVLSAGTRLETEAGFGGRHTRYVGGARKRDAITRLAVKFIHAFGAGTEFREEAFMEIGGDNTHTESVTSLKSRINSSFSMKLALSVVHNSRVPQDIKKTDTITSVTLVYDL